MKPTYITGPYSNRNRRRSHWPRFQPSIALLAVIGWAMVFAIAWLATWACGELWNFFN